MTRRVRWLVSAVLLIVSSAAAVAEETEAERRLATIKYGIESQVVDLLAALKQERNSDFRSQILSLLEATTSRKIREAALDYFGALELPDAAAVAAGFVRSRDTAADSTVAAAFTYLIAVKSDAAAAEAAAIVKDDETKYLVAAIKMLGAAGGPSASGVLVEAYGRDATPAVKQEILLAFGRMKAADSWELLAKVAADAEAGKVERMYACASLGELGDPRGIPILVAASGAEDPNVRAYAVGALGKFDTAESRNALVEALRDPHVLPRAAAAKAVGVLRLAAAVPFLDYKLKYDPERSVREAAAEALGAIGGAEALGLLEAFLEDPKNAVIYRTAVFSVLAAKGGGPASRAKAVFLAAQAEKDRAFFTSLARAALSVDKPEVEEFVAVLMADKDYTVRLGAVMWAERNLARGLLGELERLSVSDPADAVKKRALAALDRIKSR